MNLTARPHFFNFSLTELGLANVLPFAALNGAADTRVLTGAGAMNDPYAKRVAAMTKRLRPRPWAYEMFVEFSREATLDPTSEDKIDTLVREIQRVAASPDTKRLSVLVEGHRENDEPTSVAFDRARKIAAVLRSAGVMSEAIVSSEAIVNLETPGVLVRVLA